MREKVVEQKLVQAVRRSGGLALKLVSPGFNGVPDRLLLFPGARAAFCELKAPGQKPRPLQVHRMNQLRKLGFPVYVVDSAEQIKEVLLECQTGPWGEAPLNKLSPSPCKPGSSNPIAGARGRGAGERENEMHEV